ncbi:MAG: hypothetical protein PHT12_01030 [Patescibacteria group bacterium]|nr:hypothetical protein [Patescibacteria group bacterium]
MEQTLNKPAAPPSHRPPTRLILIVIGVVVVIAAVLTLMQTKPNDVARPSSVSPTVTEQPGLKIPTQPQVEPTDFVFERTVKLGEPAEMQIRFRDYSTVPADFASMDELEGKLKSVPGLITMTVNSVEPKAAIGEMAEVGNAVYFAANFSVKGDANNPTGNLIHPGSLEEIGKDMFPQIVLIKANAVVTMDPDASRLYARAKQLPNFRRATPTMTEPINLTAVWKWPYANHPILALEYVNASGEKKYIRVQY